MEAADDGSRIWNRDALTEIQGLVDRLQLSRNHQGADEGLEVRLGQSCLQDEAAWQLARQESRIGDAELEVADELCALWNPLDGVIRWAVRPADADWPLGAEADAYHAACLRGPASK